MTDINSVEDYHPPYFWQANGLLSLFPTSVAGALNGLATAQIGLAAGAGSFDGFRQAFTGLLIDSTAGVGTAPGIIMRQRVDGSAGTTTVEVYRLRAAVWTLLATVSLAFGGGGGAGIGCTSNDGPTAVEQG